MYLLLLTYVSIVPIMKHMGILLSRDLAPVHLGSIPATRKIRTNGIVLLSMMFSPFEKVVENMILLSVIYLHTVQVVS